MSVLVAGCGDLGTEVALRLVAEGAEVLGLRRSAHLLPPEITGLAADLHAPDLTVPAGVTRLVYTAAADERSEAAYRRAYVTGVRNVLAALARSGAVLERALLVSSTAVYGVSDGSVVDERTPAEPATDTGRVLLEAERAFRCAVPGGVVLRLAGIYGPGRTWLVEQVRGGTAVVPSRPVHTNRIHRDDAAAAAVHLLTRVPSPEGCYLGVDDEPAELGAVLRHLAAALGLDDPPVGEAARRRGGDKRCGNARLRASGWAPRYPSYREGYDAVLAGVGVRHP